MPDFSCPASGPSPTVEWDHGSYFWAWHGWLAEAACARDADACREVCIVADPRTGEFGFYGYVPRSLGGDDDGESGMLPAPEGGVIADRSRLDDVEAASYWVSLASESLEEQGNLDEEDLADLEQGAWKMVDLSFDDAVERVEKELARRRERGGGGAP